MVELNYLSVIAAGFAIFVTGALWYGPVFGKAWMSLMGFNKESIKTMKLTPAQAMALGFISSVLTSYVLAYFVSLLNISDAHGALQLAFWIWIGFVATTVFGSFLWEGKPIKLFVLNASYHLVALSAASVY